MASSLQQRFQLVDARARGIDRRVNQNGAWMNGGISTEPGAATDPQELVSAGNEIDRANERSANQAGDEESSLHLSPT
jgi:hypothetical protein